MRNLSPGACTLQGHPRVFLVTQHGRRIRVVVRHPDHAMKARPVWLRPRGRAIVRVQWFNGCHHIARHPEMQMTLPGATKRIGVLAVSPLAPPRCDDASKPSVLDVRRFAPWPKRTARAAAVPNVYGIPIQTAYRRAIRFGWQVRFPGPIGFASLCDPHIEGQSPPPGTRLRPGRAISLTVGCALASPSGPFGTVDPVPEVRGQPVSRALAEIEAAGLEWSVRLAALHRGRRRHLLDNWIVTEQSPPAGTVSGSGGPSVSLRARAR